MLQLFLLHSIVYSLERFPVKLVRWLYVVSDSDGEFYSILEILLVELIYEALRNS